MWIYILWLYEPIMWLNWCARCILSVFSSCIFLLCSLCAVRNQTHSHIHITQSTTANLKKKKHCCCCFTEFKIHAPVRSAYFMRTFNVLYGFFYSLGKCKCSTFSNIVNIMWYQNAWYQNACEKKKWISFSIDQLKLRQLKRVLVCWRIKIK